MKGYLMQEKVIVRGEECFIESLSPENRNAVVFEDDGETAYFYAMEMDETGGGMKILDALHIYEVSEDEGPEIEESEGEEVSLRGKKSKLQIVWSKDWMKCALVLEGYCQAIFNFEAQGGYSINEFPPPNEIWTKGDRKLTNAMIQDLF
jgi:hypothetical protein